MANVDWYVEGNAFGNCNCIDGCPCQFEGIPTHGGCHGFEVLNIEKGHFGDVDLAGVNFAMLYHWPGPIFEGKGQMQAIIDERASEAQRAAIKTVAHGGETDEAATHWWVFRAMSDTVHETLYLPIEYEVDVDARRAKVSIPGILESTGYPIVAPHGGGEHRVRIDIPGGIEFTLAEIGKATTKTSGGVIALDLAGSYGQFHRMRHGPGGVIH